MPRRHFQSQIASCLIGLLVLAGCGGNLTPANSAPSAPSVSIATPGQPPNAEKNGRAWGPVDAPLRVVKFMDYQCPTCGRLAREYDPAIVDAFASTGKVRMEVRILTFIGRESYDAALAALCAGDQNAFWQMHNSIFLNQSFDGRENTGIFTKPKLKDMAASMGLDTATFDTCLDSEKHRDTLELDRLAAKQAGIAAVPTFVVNDRVYTGLRTVDDLREIFKTIAPAVNLD